MNELIVETAVYGVRLERDVHDYYALFGEREWARLEIPSDGQVEFAIVAHPGW